MSATPHQGFDCPERCPDCMEESYEASLATAIRQRDELASKAQEHLAGWNTATNRAEAAERERDRLREISETMTGPAKLQEARDRVVALEEALLPFVECLNPDALMQGEEWPDRFREYISAARAALAAPTKEEA